ncbi:MAG: serine hydrolase domain-containing protein [Bacteroidota bacterium]
MNKIITLIVLIVCNTSFAQINLSANKAQATDSILESYCNPNEPGMAISIVQNGNVIYKNAIGYADISNSLSLTDSTAFNIASVSKQFTALLALMASEEGKISLQDSITQYLPELKSLPYKITIEQLANHTHGLPNYSDLIAMIGFGLASPISNDQAVQTILSIEEVNFKAGTQYQYGNSGYMLLAEILKRVYEKSFPLLVKEMIFEPLNMTQSVVIDNPNTIVYNKALAYTKNGDIYIEHPNRQMECGSSNIHTTLNDMIKWVINFQNPKVGTENQMNRLMIKTISLSRDSDLGYGLGLLTEKYKGLETVFHGGGTAGYRAYILHVPKHNFSVITLGNQESFDSLLIVQDLLDLYLKDYMQEPNSIKTAYSENELREYAGTYKVSPGQYWTIESNEKDLYFGGIQEPLPLIGNGKFKFFLPTSYLTFYSNSMDFRIADFNYTYEKVNLNPPVLEKDELEKYVGVFKNEEFNIFYEVLIMENKLIAKHLTNGEIILNPLSKNSFYAEYPLGELDFKLDTEGGVKAFVLSGQNFNNIKFLKVN